MLGKPQYIIGIDTSCDETSIAVLEKSTGQVLSNVVSSQIALHADHGGIVPELASRAHTENVSAVFDEALKRAEIHLNEIGGIAVTKTPGLMGCLLVGTSFAKSLAYNLGVPIYGVNHLEGHLFSSFIGEHDSTEAFLKSDLFPFLGLVVSGGHTAFYLVKGVHDIEVVGQTVDDAAGEAFDKCAKMLGLGYPGGPVIDKRSKNGDASSFPFTIAKVKMGEQYLSFSGLKTAAYHHISNQEQMNDSVIDDLCASLQNGIVKALTQKIEYLVTKSDVEIKSFALSGGVAMNSLLRTRCREVCDQLQMPCYIAAPKFCTDNGAMIAYAALLKEQVDDLFTLQTRPTKKIQARKLKHETLNS